MQDTEQSYRQFYDSLNHSLADLYDGAEEAGSYGVQDELEAIDERYELLEQIGEGGSKTVFRAKDRVTEGFVAVATLKANAAGGVREQFFREARLNAGLVHPAVIRVYDMGELPDGRPFFVMTLMTGRSLAEMIEDEAGGTSVADRLEIFVKICDGISYAHSRGVLHLDLKPANVQIGEYGEVMICDWGLAKVLDQTSSVVQPTTETELDADLLTNATMSGIVKGTLGYMAPEQASAGVKTVATDVYALGALLYVLLTGKPPVSGSTRLESLRNTREGRLDLRHGENLGEPKRLMAVVRRALATAPDDRYESVDALRREVGRYLAGRPTIAERPSPATRLTLYFQRNRRFALTVFGAAAAIVGLSLAASLALENSRDEAVSARDQARLSEDYALRQATEAAAAQRRAEEALSRYESERQRRQRLGTELETLEVALGRVAVQDARFDDALRALKTAVEHNSEDLRAWEEKGTVHLIRQEFVAAESAFERGGTHFDAGIRQLCRRFAEIKPDDAARLGTAQTAAFLNAFPQWRPGLRLQAFRYVSTNVEDPYAHLELVRMELQRLNPEAGKIRIELRELAKDHLHLKVWPDSGLSVLHLPDPSSLNVISVFSGLGLSSLDLKGVAITTVAGIGHLPRLESLNVSGTRASRLADLLRAPALKRLVVHGGQLTAEDEALLSERFRIETVKR